MKYYLKLLSIPLFFLIIYTSLVVVWNVFNFPSVATLTEIVSAWFDKYGIPALFFSSILEGMLLIGSYFPGVFVIFLGVLVADSPLEATLAVFVGTVGLIIAHIINYLLGKYGWYKLLVKFGMEDAIERSKDKLERKGPIAIPLSYGFPSIGALTNTAAGIIHMPFRKFITYSIASSVVWYSFVGFLVYQIGDYSLEIAGGSSANWLVFTVVFVWMAVLVILDRRQKREGS